MAASVTYGYPPYPLTPVLPHSPLGGATLQLISPGGVLHSKSERVFVHGYNGGRGTIKRSAAETALNLGPISPTERSEPDELGYATVRRKVAGSSPGKQMCPLASPG